MATTPREAFYGDHWGFSGQFGALSFFSSIKLGSKIDHLTEAPTQNLGDWQATKDLNTMIVMPLGKC